MPGTTKAYLLVGVHPVKLGDRITIHEVTLPDSRDEAYRHAAWQEQHRHEDAARLQRYAAGYSTMLDADPSSRVVLELHHPVEKMPGYIDDLVCAGCDGDGYDTEAPSWPCRTVEALAQHHGLDMTYNGHEHGGNGPRT